MVLLIVLVVVTLLARLIGHLKVARLRDWAASTRVGLAVMYCFTGAAHFTSMRADMVAMVPPSVPNPELMVTFTGICEVLGGVGLLLPQTRRIAAWALIALMLAVLPANIHAAQAGVTLRGAPATPIGPRVALQGLFIAVLWWSGVAGGHNGRRGLKGRAMFSYLRALAARLAGRGFTGLPPAAPGEPYARVREPRKRGPGGKSASVALAEPEERRVVRASASARLHEPDDEEKEMHD